MVPPEHGVDPVATHECRCGRVRSLASRSTRIKMWLVWICAGRVLLCFKAERNTLYWKRRTIASRPVLGCAATPDPRLAPKGQMLLAVASTERRSHGRARKGVCMARTATSYREITTLLSARR